MKPSLPKKADRIDWSGQLSDAYRSQRRSRSEQERSQGALPVQKPNLLRHVFVVLALTLLVGFYFWASRSELESIVRGTGKVIPDSANQIIQSLEGGILSELYVSEGDSVAKGDLLAQIHDAQAAAVHERNLVARDTLLGRISRLEAEATGSQEIRFPTDFEKARPEIAVRERKIFEARKTHLQLQLHFSRNRFQKEREKMDLLAPSFSSGALPPSEKLTLEAKLIELQEVAETIEPTFRREAYEAIDEANSRLVTLLAEMQADEDRVTRTAVLSPINGTVNTLHIETTGRVVHGGEPIMELVPTGDSLLIEARIRPSDIAFLHQGQPVNINFTAYDFSIYGGLRGGIETIGVDTVVDAEKKETYYPIKIRTEKSSLGIDPKTGEELGLVPGMVAEVNIVVGKRSVLDYLLKPINRARMHALRER